ncbi:MAG TPA: glycoside hydrolase family 15 protein [Gaiellaceae bacterium]|jgi:GH15 family glucan-1,4-alpha-glucosidase|nr:glycoside hydrolase family 15 protein [Gaiellaceae bacterium]
MSRIEDYALLGDLQTAALVDRDGSIDWLCFPRFDSGACFAALLGDQDNGRWLLAPVEGSWKSTRRYLHDTLVLETTWESDDGTVRVIDFMPPRGEAPDIVRVVEGVRGRVHMRSELVVRFDYGRTVPWVRRIDQGRVATAGPDALCFRTPAPTRGENMRTVSEFAVDEGERMPFVLTWFPSHEKLPRAIDPERALAETESFWREWSAACVVDLPEEWAALVRRSLVVLKALTYAPTGGIVAAPTTSLPEWIGSVRNWDYRFCWLRDATLTLLALLHGGHAEEAAAWRQWLLRAVAGNPADVQIMYGVAGERRLSEFELPWLGGYEGSAPVRVGNAASEQLQLDVYGEVLDALYQARTSGLALEQQAWQIQLALLEHLEEAWREPDEGIWEIRGERRHFVHSKAMAWVAFDRAVRTVEGQGLDGPVDRWRNVRDEIHAEVCEHGFDAALGSFVQSYGSKELDASLLLLPLVGFLPAADERISGTVAAVERELLQDGFLLRYRTHERGVDGLPPGEGVFLPCSFWLADCYELLGRHDDAHALFERLAGLANDLGLLSEEYDPKAGRLLGNFPQAFTHLALVNSAFNVAPHLPSPMHRRHASSDH